MQVQIGSVTNAGNCYLRVYQNTNDQGWESSLTGTVSSENNPIVYASSNSGSNIGFPYTSFKNLDVTFNPQGNHSLKATTQDLLLENGKVRITDLGGSGDQMVVTDNDGDLSIQALPSSSTDDQIIDELMKKFRKDGILFEIPNIFR